MSEFRIKILSSISPCSNTYEGHPKLSVEPANPTVTGEGEIFKADMPSLVHY